MKGGSNDAKIEITMEPDAIFIKGAREYNLKDIDVVIPRNKLVVVSSRFLLSLNIQRGPPCFSVFPAPP